MISLMDPKFVYLGETINRLTDFMDFIIAKDVPSLFDQLYPIYENLMKDRFESDFDSLSLPDTVLDMHVRFSDYYQAGIRS